MGQFNRIRRNGEGLAAAIGLSAFGTLLLAILCFAAFSYISQRDALLSQRAKDVASLASLLRQTTTVSVQNSELTALRRLIIDVAREHDLTTASVELPDGRVLADSDPGKINLAELPETWTGGPLDDDASVSASRFASMQTVVIPGKGTLKLRLLARAPDTSSLLSETLLLAGVLMGAAFILQLFIYRKMRAQLRALSLIRGALQALSTGESSGDAVRLSPDFGPEATAWNDLLSQAWRSRTQTASERGKVALGNRRESNLDLESAIDGLSVGVVVIDASCRIHHANGAAATLLRAKRETMHGTEVSQFIEDPTVRDVVAKIAAGTPIRRSVEIKLPGANGASYLRLHLRPLRKEDAGSALLTIEDVTQQRIADSARNAFVAQATHELRTPLTNMRLCLEDALESEIKDSEQIAAHLNLLNQETRRLERMVGDMLSVSEMEAGSIKLRNDDVRLDRLFEDLRHDFTTQASEKQLTLKFELPPKYPVLSGDRDKLMLTLQNLLGNAIKYTPASGEVRVTVRGEPNRLVVEISDSGIGISQEDQARLFERFYRANDPRVSKITGSGLGLALAREVARLHGGDITIQSELNKGSTFTLSLPILASAQAA
jgi:signal transduction histidine kinase